MDRNHIASLVSEVIIEFKKSGGTFNINQPEGEFEYLDNLKESYIRTIHDIVTYTQPDSSIKVLEIGAFFGIVSIGLSRLGYQVYATDIAEYITNKKLQHKLDENNIKYNSCNLRSYSLPYSDEAFDIVIMCEVLEHLNFNPLPLLKEINRIEKLTGLFYLSLPNLTSLRNRIKLLKGKSIHNPIADYFYQLADNTNMTIGLHWREYTTAEVKEILESLGFSIDKQYYFSSSDNLQLSGKLKLIAKKVIYGLFPDLKDNQTTIARKTQHCTQKFYFTEATAPILSRQEMSNYVRSESVL